MLNGAAPFAIDLFRACEDIDAELTFMRFKSYEGTGSTGDVKQIMGLSENLEGRHIVLIEDIIDTGNTMVSLLPSCADTSLPRSASRPCFSSLKLLSIPNSTPTT